MRARVIANPANDADFVRTVRELARSERSHRLFEANLRTRYPEARVRHGALSGDEGERWYAYRDGHWAGDSMVQVGSSAEADPGEG